MASTDDILKDFEDITKEKDRGVLKKIIKKAAGEQKACHKDSCNVRYVGTYFGGEDDGKEFDRSDNFSFQLGTQNVIKAWDLGVATMKIGEVCELIAAPEYGYNDGKTMKFEVELFSCEGEDISEKKNGSVRKSILEEGEGLVNPPYGVEAKISYKLSDSSDKPTEISYLTGDPQAHNIPIAVDICVRSMTAHEVARVAVTNGEKGDTITNYEIKLISFEKLKHLSTFNTFKEQMSYAETLKERANGHLKATKFFLAAQTYKRLASDLEYLVVNGPEEQKILDTLSVAVHNNSALAYLKLRDTDKAIDECEKALKNDMKNEKALFRLGQAYLLLNDQEEALNHFKKCLHFHQDNVDAMKMKKFCEDKIAQAKQVEKARFRGIFNRLKDTGLGINEPEPEPVEELGNASDEADLIEDGE